MENVLFHAGSTPSAKRNGLVSLAKLERHQSPFPNALSQTHPTPTDGTNGRGTCSHFSLTRACSQGVRSLVSSADASGQRKTLQTATNGLHGLDNIVWIETLRFHFILELRSPVPPSLSLPSPFPSLPFPSLPFPPLPSPPLSSPSLPSPSKTLVKFSHTCG